jgi:hypothetical protein
MRFELRLHVHTLNYLANGNIILAYTWYVGIDMTYALFVIFTIS